jgi:hypothetical protein
LSNRTVFTGKYRRIASDFRNKLTST